MAEMNVRGNELLYELAEDLDYPIEKERFPYCLYCTGRKR